MDRENILFAFLPVCWSVYACFLPHAHTAPSLCSPPLSSSLASPSILTPLGLLYSPQVLLDAARDVVLDFLDPVPPDPSPSPNLSAFRPPLIPHSLETLSPSAPQVLDYAQDVLVDWLEPVRTEPCLPSGPVPARPLQALSPNSLQALLDAARDVLMDWLDAERGSSVTDNNIFADLPRHYEAEYDEDMDALNVSAQSSFRAGETEPTRVINRPGIHIK